MPSFYSIKTRELIQTPFYKNAVELGGLPRVSEICTFNKSSEFYKTSNAASDGTRLHLILSEKADPETEIEYAISKNLQEWEDVNINAGWEKSENETVIIDKLIGYGGTCDKIMYQGRSRMIVDWKTMNVKSNIPDFSNKAWIMQLAAYCMANQTRRKTNDYLYSIIVDRITGKFYSYQWTDEEFAWGWKTFKYFHLAYCQYYSIPIKNIRQTNT